jgi:hypothetical protein
VTDGQRVGEGLIWASGLAAVACCGIPVLLAAGVAGAVLWPAALSVAGAIFAALGVAFYLRRGSRTCEECRRRGTRTMHERAHGGGGRR